MCGLHIRVHHPRSKENGKHPFINLKKSKARVGTGKMSLRCRRKVIWNKKMTKRLIRQYKKHPCLYDLTNADFGKEEVTETSWKAIADSIGRLSKTILSKESIQKKTKKMVMEYYKTSELVGKVVKYEPVWWYESLDFLKGKENVYAKRNPCNSSSASSPSVIPASSSGIENKYVPAQKEQAAHSVNSSFTAKDDEGGTFDATSSALLPEEDAVFCKFLEYYLNNLPIEGTHQLRTTILKEVTKKTCFKNKLKLVFTVELL